LTCGRVLENDERSFNFILGALREAIEENPRLIEMPAEEVARQLVLEGRLGEEPVPSVAEALESREAEQQSLETEKITSKEANLT
jgi:hypothetical protein